MRWEGHRWFNLSAPWFHRGGLWVRLWNVFRRCSTDGHYWGIGILQVGQRHLLYIGHSGAMLGFMGRKP
jgi:hypothetical protein